VLTGGTATDGPPGRPPLVGAGGQAAVAGSRQVDPSVVGRAADQAGRLLVAAPAGVCGAPAAGQPAG
jgi:hypothetical protein